MTTKIAEKLYQAQHNSEMEGKNWAIYNPNKKELKDLPIIYGFNNGGPSVFLSGQLIAEDGTALGGHACSNECYMEHDLGILEGTRPDRHETFKKHYPKGYKMEFYGYEDAKKHKGIDKAYELNKKLKT